VGERLGVADNYSVKTGSLICSRGPSGPAHTMADRSSSCPRNSRRRFVTLLRLKGAFHSELRPGIQSMNCSAWETVRIVQTATDGGRAPLPAHIGTQPVRDRIHPRSVTQAELDLESPQCAQISKINGSQAALART